MSRFKPGAIIAAAGVALVIAAIPAVAASAAFTLSTEVCNGTIVNLCWENAGTKEELTGTQAITVTKKPFSPNIIFSGTLGGVRFTIECTAAKQGALGTNALKQSAPLSGTGSIELRLNFEGCNLVDPRELAEDCEVPTELETLSLEGGLTSVKELKLLPLLVETAPLIILTFTTHLGAPPEPCPSTFTTGTHAVTGFQVIENLTPETAEATKSGKAIGETLKLGGKAAKLTGELTLSFTGLGDSVAILAKA